MVWCQPHIWPSLNRLCRPSYSLQIFVFEKQNKNKRLFNKTHETEKDNLTHVENRTASSTSFWTPPSLPGKAGTLFLSFKCNEVEITTVSFFSQVALLWRQMWPARSRGTRLSQQGWKQCRKAETPSFKSVKKDTLLLTGLGTASLYEPFSMAVRKLLGQRMCYHRYCLFVKGQNMMWKKCKKKRRKRQKENIFQVLQHNLFFFALRRVAQSPVLQTWLWLCISQALHAALYTQSL